MGKIEGDSVKRYREWKKKHRDFPLTVHKCGQWVKKINGETRYFGPLCDPDGARQLWLAEKDYHKAGIKPPTDKAGLLVEELIDKFMESVDSRIARGVMRNATKKKYSLIKNIFKRAGVLSMPVKIMTPKHFSAVRVALEDGLSLSTQASRITAIKTVFRWGESMGLCGAVSFGPDMKVPSLDAIESQNEESGRTRFFDREFIVSAIGKASPPMKVVILLGINCGFYQSDSISIPLGNLHLDGPIPYHDFRRVKNKRRRMAVLWPETVEAIRDYCDNHRRPIDRNERTLVLNRFGRPYEFECGASVTHGNFLYIAKRIGGAPRGAGLGSLRHTYATIIDTVPDQAMIDLTMGHVSHGLQKRRYKQLNLNELERLKTIADVAHDWLFAIQC